MRIKFTQAAIYVPDSVKIGENLASEFGVTDFYHDNMNMAGMVMGKHVRKMDLHLAFTYQLFANSEMEMEYIRSGSLSHWHRKIISSRGDFPFLSHLGVYFDDKEFQDAFNELSLKHNMLQNTVSYGHTNEREDGTIRSYQDVIFDTENDFGFRLKMTRRL